MKPAQLGQRFITLILVLPLGLAAVDAAAGDTEKVDASATRSAAGLTPTAIDLKQKWTRHVIAAGSAVLRGSASNNVIVRNNIASVMDLDTPSTTIAIDHNLVGSQIVWYAKGKEQWLTLPGTYGSKNVIDLHGRIDTVRCLSWGQS